ncbi:MAG TPA: ribonuclease P [Methanomicrobiales archaeon]|nr:ribonuclease P [Methanomicrobiales archaeon]
MGRRSQTPETRRLARERIGILFDRAREFFPENPEVSDRCVDLARRIAMRQRVRIPRPLRRRFCRRCSAYLVPGSTLRVRVHRGKVVTTCIRCNAHRRYRVNRHQEMKSRDG